MAEEARLQVRTKADPEKWESVGPGAEGVPVPVDVEASVLPTGAATSANQDTQITNEEEIIANQTNGTQKVKLTDQYGFMVEATPMDELRTVIPTRLVGSTFAGNTIDSNFWNVTIAASGGTIATAVQANGEVVLSSKTDATGSVIVQSVRSARYTGGSSNRYRSQVQFSDTGKANNTKRWGIFDGTNGAYFKLSGTTLSVCTMKGGSETPVASADWNGSTTTPTLTNVNTYEIYITNSKVYFIIGGILKHTVNASAATWTASMNLPVRADNINSGNTTDTTMSIRVMTAYRLGNLSTQPISKFQSGTTAGLVLKYGAGNIHGLIISAITQNSVVTLYDNTAASGTVIWASGAMAAQTQPFELEMHDIPFSIGLTLVISGANANVLVAYE